VQLLAQHLEILLSRMRQQEVNDGFMPVGDFLDLGR
jgi:hypothetical protein